MYLIQTIQTSWRPQLPLPKESRIANEQEDIDIEVEIETISVSDTNDMTDHERQSHQGALGASHIGHVKQHHAHKHDNHMPMQSNGNGNSSGNGPKKWSFGRLFRKNNKKDTENNNSSSEEDRKAGFSPDQRHARVNGGTSSNCSGSNNNTNKLLKMHKNSNKNNSQRGSKYIGAGFDHIVVHPQQQPPMASKMRQQLSTKSHIDNEFFLPVETITPEEVYYQQQQQRHQQQQHQLKRNSRSTNSVDQRNSMMSSRNAAISPKSRSSQRLQSTAVQVHSGMNPDAGSSDEELISLNSSTFSKYRSDESIHSGNLMQQGINNMSRRSRAARNERYYKRLSRDGETSTGQIPQYVKPQLSVYNAQPQQKQPHLSNHGSLQHVPTEPYMQWNQLKQLQQQQMPHQDYQGKKSLQNSLMSDNKRSISYDSQIHLQNINGGLQTKPLPPPPPPRDPMRRVNINSTNNPNNNRVNCSVGDLRPLSYAFDPVQTTIQPPLVVTPIANNTGLSALNARCVSDDKIWASGKARAGHYQSENSSLNMSMPQSRRFITRAERDAQLSKQSLPNGIEFHYVADATPRSRKPIHLVEPEAGILRTSRTGLVCSESTGNLNNTSSNWRASDFWKRLDEGSQHHGRERTRISNQPQSQSQKIVEKPRSISSSRAAELRTYPIYTEIQKPNRVNPQQQQLNIDEIDNVVCGSLHIKRADDKANNYVEIRHKDVMNKSNSMPNHYNRNKADECRSPLSNKYEQYVAEKREQQKQLSIQNPPTPPQRKLSIPTTTLNLVPQSLQIPRKKPTNLEEAISELEAIYKSLGLTEPDENKSEELAKLQIKSSNKEINDFDSYALAHADEYDDEEDSPAGEPDPVRDDVAYRNIKLANLQHKTNEKQLPFGIPIGPIVRAPQTDYLHVEPIKDPPHEAYDAPDIVKDDLAVRALRKDPIGPKEPRFIYPANSSALIQKKNRASRTQSANIYSLIQRDAAKPSGGDMHSFLELTKNIDRCGSMSDIHKEEGLNNGDIPSTLKLLRNLKEQEQEQELIDRKKNIPFRHPSKGGAICQLPEKLIITEDKSPPVPMPRKSLTPEPASVNHRMEDALNKIAKDAQESSMKLSKELLELRKEALITHSRTKINCAEEEKLAKDLQEIEAVSEAAKRCGKLLLDTLPDATDDAEETAVKQRRLHKEGKLIRAIDQVSEAANAVCEKILKDMGPDQPTANNKEYNKNTANEMPLVMPNLIKKLDPIQPENIELIANRCMRQISELVASPDYDNLATDEKDKSPICTNKNTNNNNKLPAIISDKISQNADDTLISTVAEVNAKNPTIMKTLTSVDKTNKRQQEIDEIDKIMQECEAQVRSEKRVQQTKSSLDRYNHGGNANSCFPSSGNNMANNAASSFSSSSDCLAKSTSSSASRRQSSSITSFNPYSSSDYIKSPSSEFHAPSTDPIKTFSTTSYDVKSSSVTPNMTTSTFSYSPSPPPPPLEPLATKSLNSDSTTTTEKTVLTVANGRNSSSQDRHSSSASQYNSSEELAMIFGIKEKRSTSATTPQFSGKVFAQPTLQTTPSNSALSSPAITINNNYHASLVLNNNQCQTPNPVKLSNSCKSNNNQNTDDPIVTHSKTDDEINVFTNPITIISNTSSSSHTNPTNSFCTSVVSTCKLDTIPEITIEQDVQTYGDLGQPSNYATKIKIELQDIEELSSLNKISPNPSAQLLESFNSLEEISSKSDSGNDSLADYPLLASHAKSLLLLQPAYNNRFEIKNSSFPIDDKVNTNLKCEVKTELEEIELESESKIGHEEYVDKDKEFPPPPTAEELCEALQEGSSENTDDKALSRKGSIVYETPQLNMNISEIKVNYEYAVSEQPANEVKNAENIDDNALRQGAIKKDCKLRKIKSETKPESGAECMPKRNATDTISTVSKELNSRRKLSKKYDKPTTSMLGEMRSTAVDAADNYSLTTLEHVLIACSLGVITPNDLFTVCLLIIGIITVLALVLL